MRFFLYIIWMSKQHCSTCSTFIICCDTSEIIKVQEYWFKYISEWQMVAKPLPATIQQVVRFGRASDKGGFWMWVIGLKFVGLWLFRQWAAWNLHPFVRGFAPQLCTFPPRFGWVARGQPQKLCKHMSCPNQPNTVIEWKLMFPLG